MLPAQKLRGTVAAGVWLASDVALIYLAQTYGANLNPVLGFVLLLTNLCVYIYAFCTFTKAKGYSPLLGIVLALLMIVGAVVLLILPDKHRR